MPTDIPHAHTKNHAFIDLNARVREGMALCNRRGMLKASLAGMAGLSLPQLLARRANAVAAGQSMSSRKSVILLWLAGGPSHLDTWDPKPTRPFENRGPFGVTQTALPGVHFCEHLPKQAAMADKFTVIRSVDCRMSNHEPNMVMQTGNREAGPRVNPQGHLYPAYGSIISKFRGANEPGLPPYVAFQRSRSHVAYGGYLGQKHDPFLAQQVTKLPIYDLVGNDTGQVGGAPLFTLASGLDSARIGSRRELLQQIDQIRSHLDNAGWMDAFDTYNQQAAEMVTGPRAREAFDIEREDPRIRARYGKHLWSQQTLIARRLVEAGVSFVTLDLSYHTSSGTWDNHGIPGGVYGGISKGLGPLLPLFDHLYTTLLTDLEERGLLDDVLVVAMGEFGRTPNIGTQGSTDGRNHWPVVMSMLLAGGGLRHGQVIGASESDGADIALRPVTPADLAATIYRHMDVPLDTTYLDSRGRPRYIIEEGGQPLRELF